MHFVVDRTVQLEEGGFLYQPSPVDVVDVINGVARRSMAYLQPGVECRVALLPTTDPLLQRAPRLVDPKRLVQVWYCCVSVS